MFVISVLCVIPITVYAQSPESSKAIIVDGTDFSVQYQMSGGKLLSAIPDPDAASLILSVQMDNAGILSITLPRNLIDSKIGEQDDIYFVLIDADEANFTESVTQTDRTITILIPAGSDQIEIIGTKVVPEFPFGIIIMFISMSAISYLTKFKTLAV